MKKRESNFELLRILSMMMIVGLHYLNKNMGGALGEQSLGELNYFITLTLESLFIIGVNCFVLITGYFQIEKASIKLTKVLELLITMIFYGAFLYGVALIFGWTTFSITEMLLELFPIFFGLKWFIKHYIVLYVLTPFINRGLQTLSKREYQWLLVISLILFSLWPSFLPSPPVTDRGYGFITFILVYSIGGYIKKYFNASKPKWFYLAGYFINVLIILGFIIGFEMLFRKGTGQSIVWGYNFIFNIIGSVSLFLFFSKLEIQSSFINKVAQHTLGVYFAHTSPVTYGFLYGTLLQTQNFWHSSWFVVHVIGSVLLVYFLATIIDMGRHVLFGKIEEKAAPCLKKKVPILYSEIP